MAWNMNPLKIEEAVAGFQRTSDPNTFRRLARNYVPFRDLWAKAFCPDDLKAGRRIFNDLFRKAATRYRPFKGEAARKWVGRSAFNAYLVTCLVNKVKSLNWERRMADRRGKKKACVFSEVHI